MPHFQALKKQHLSKGYVPRTSHDVTTQKTYVDIFTPSEPDNSDLENVLVITAGDVLRDPSDIPCQLWILPQRHQTSWSSG
jgi:hypothetical protein